MRTISNEAIPKTAIDPGSLDVLPDTHVLASVLGGSEGAAMEAAAKALERAGGVLGLARLGFGELSSHSNVPTNQVCFNCHGAGKGQIKLASPKLEPVRKAAETGDPIKWVKIHKAPDYVYFNHSAHLNRGISCVSCHGKVNEMEVVYHDQPQSMGWCLDCHRNPEKNLRPLTELTNLNYKPENLDRTVFYKSLLAKNSAADIAAEIPGGKGATATDAASLATLAQKAYGEKVTQTEVGTQLKKHWNILPPQDCTACHR